MAQASAYSVPDWLKQSLLRGVVDFLVGMGCAMIVPLGDTLVRFFFRTAPMPHAIWYLLEFGIASIAIAIWNATRGVRRANAPLHVALVVARSILGFGTLATFLLVGTCCAPHGFPLMRYVPIPTAVVALGVGLVWIVHRAGGKRTCRRSL